MTAACVWINIKRQRTIQLHSFIRRSIAKKPAWVEITCLQVISIAEPKTNYVVRWLSSPFDSATRPPKSHGSTGCLQHRAGTRQHSHHEHQESGLGAGLWDGERPRWTLDLLPISGDALVVSPVGITRLSVPLGPHPGWVGAWLWRSKVKSMFVKAGRRSLRASIPAQRGCASAFFF